MFLRMFKKLVLFGLLFAFASNVLCMESAPSAGASEDERIYGQLKNMLSFKAFFGAIDVSVRSQKARNPLFNPNYKGQLLLDAVALNDPEAIECLLRNGVNINDREVETGRTALYYAAENCCNNVIDCLLDNGAWLNAGTCDGITPLAAAVAVKNFPVIKKLVERGALINLPNNIGSTALHYAVISGDLDITKFLIENGGCVHVGNPKNHQATPIYLAVGGFRAHEGGPLTGMPNLDMARLLISHGAEITQETLRDFKKFHKNRLAQKVKLFTDMEQLINRTMKGECVEAQTVVSFDAGIDYWLAELGDIGPTKKPATLKRKQQQRKPSAVSASRPDAVSMVAQCVSGQAVVSADAPFTVEVDDAGPEACVTVKMQKKPGVVGQSGSAVASMLASGGGSSVLDTCCEVGGSTGAASGVLEGAALLDVAVDLRERLAFSPGSSIDFYFEAGSGTGVAFDATARRRLSLLCSMDADEEARFLQLYEKTPSTAGGLCLLDPRVQGCCCAHIRTRAEPLTSDVIDHTFSIGLMLKALVNGSAYLSRDLTNPRAKECLLIVAPITRTLSGSLLPCPLTKKRFLTICFGIGRDSKVEHCYHFCAQASHPSEVLTDAGRRKYSLRPVKVTAKIKALNVARNHYRLKLKLATEASTGGAGA
jgi:ankyrin repeat protein